MSISVIIPSKTASNLVPCMQAVHQHEPTAKIIAVWDGPEETAPTALERESIIPGKHPFIYARNCNLGIQAAGNDDVVLLNDDALLKTPLSFTALQAICEANHDIGIIGAVTNVTGQPAQKPQGVGLREVPHFAFVCVFIPRRTIDAIGMLDERYCIDYGVEDRDYCEAVRRAGLKVAVHDGCYVDHGSLYSSFRGDPRAPRSFMQNWKLFCEKWGPQPL